MHNLTLFMYSLSNGSYLISAAWSLVNVRHILISDSENQEMYVLDVMKYDIQIETNKVLPFSILTDDILSFAPSLIDATAPEVSTLHPSPLRHRGPPQRAAGVGLDSGPHSKSPV